MENELGWWETLIVWLVFAGFYWLGYWFRGTKKIKKPKHQYNDYLMPGLWKCGNCDEEHEQPTGWRWRGGGWQHFCPGEDYSQCFRVDREKLIHIPNGDG